MRPATLFLLCALTALGSGGGSALHDQGGSCGSGDSNSVAGHSVLQKSALRELTAGHAFEESEERPETEPEPEPEPEQERAKRAEDARFLMQSTFGPTAELLEELKESTYAQWIQRQMQLPAGSHREYYRKRVNPALGGSPPASAMRGTPCEQGRFRSFAFGHSDVGKKVEVSSSAINVDGKLRSELMHLPLASNWIGAAGFTGIVCKVREELGGDVHIAEGEAKDMSMVRRLCNKRRALPNPSVWRSAGAPELSGTLLHLKSGVAVLAEGSCALQLPSDGSHLFVQAGGTHYLYEERMRLLENTQEQPQVDGGAKVPRNHLNEMSCSLKVSCGSVGEVASEPGLGHHMPLLGSSEGYDSRYANKMSRTLAKSTVWTMKVLQGDDQLRQRMAWALSQIFVVSAQTTPDDDMTEMWVSYYDHFVTNAFGNFRDVLEAITFNPVMGRYLTHTGSSSYDYNGNMPNENFGREIMQLFTIGLDLLNPDGTVQKDAAGATLPSYTTENILSNARVFTGFLEQAGRQNIEQKGDRNLVDPMRVSPERHDIYPKPSLTGGYLGDGYPLCSEPVPQGTFLRKGAKFEYAFHRPGATDGLQLAANSKLAEALCGPEGKCSRLVVVLEKDLPCTGEECEAGSVPYVKVGWQWFKHVLPPCVHTYFSATKAQQAAGLVQEASSGWEMGWCVQADRRARATRLDKKDGNSAERKAECEAMCRAKGGTGCQLIWSQWNKGCYVVTWTVPFSANGYKRNHACWVFGKVMPTPQPTPKPTPAPTPAPTPEPATPEPATGSYVLLGKDQQCAAGTAVMDAGECAKAAMAQGLTFHEGACSHYRHLCPDGCAFSRLNRGGVTFSKGGGVRHRLAPPLRLCKAFMTVGEDGAMVMPNGHTSFRLADLEPPVSAGVHLVESAEMKPVFAKLPSKDEALAKLSLGARMPEGACSLCEGSVKAYGSKGNDLDVDTVLEVDGSFYRNAESRVQLQTGESFRNPPVFLRSSDIFVDLEDRHAWQLSFAETQVLAEVDALLDSLFRHQNTAAFIGRRLIQRFVSSNPSPGYVAAVSAAFSMGSYGGVTFSGKYGDLAATVAAVLLHPEARELPKGQATTSRGALREPMMKFVHLMRAMRYRDDEQVVFRQLQDVIGQFPYQAPSVFNYYLADYGLPMVTTEPEPEPEEPEPEPEPESLVGPEFQIFTPPYMVGYLNGMQTLIQSGVDIECTDGTDLGISASFPDDDKYRNICPQGSLSWQGAGSPNRTLEELNVLLTGGRLTPASKEVVKQAYEAAAEGEKIEAAQKAMVMTAEFNTLGAPLPLAGTRPEPANQEAGAQAPYKAVVFLYLAGGADTWNMLVPQSCALYEEYRTIRTDLTLEPNELLRIRTSGQKCRDFGIHASFDFVKKLYDRGQAAFVTNIGNLAEPTTMQTFRSGDAERCFNLFSHSDQSNGAMTLKCQEFGTTAHGAGGRIADALAEGTQKLRAESFSLAGASVWSKGAVTDREVVDGRGSQVFKGFEEWMPAIANLTSQRHGNVYAEAYNEAFLRGVETSEFLHSTLREARTATQYDKGRGNDLRAQLYQVARLVSSREVRKAERDFFFVSIGGWDMHSDLRPGLQGAFGKVDDALQGFVEELEAQKVWKDVVIMTSSEFARTLDSNGGGSDHAWAGQQIILGGSVKGGRVFNSFPASLKPGSVRDLGRGRLIPEYPWESMLVPIADWLGVARDQFPVAFPNLASFNTSHIIPTSQLFRSA